ncbi:MAG TPA: metallophosphoesterase [Pseudonocardiaceae bacterium]
MRVHVVSDVHGNAEALARAGDGADALVVLGDLIDFVDYDDHSAGILGRVFGPERVRRFAELRATPGGDLVGFVRSLWAGLDDPAAVVEAEVRAQYERLFAALTAPTYATPGNVDLPHLWPEYAGAGVTVCDGTVADIGGRLFGFVGGAVLPPGVRPRTGPRPWTPYLRAGAEYAAAVDGLPDVDVLASHIPPAVPELCYDVVARHPERGSTELLGYLTRRRPPLALFGHVHAPLARRARVHSTECVNVGHFRRTESPYVLTW